MKTVISFIILSILLFSCSTTKNSAIEAGDDGFTSEIDEPSVRGQLQRVSSKPIDVKYKFAVSPNDSVIVYSGSQAEGGDGLLQLWKIPADGNGSATKITSGGSSDYTSPSFTPDGKYIVYSSEGNLWRVRSDGAGGKLSIPGSGGIDFGPDVSSDGKLVFFSLQRTNERTKPLIWTSNIDGGELMQLREGIYPRWSPDGKRIVFEHEGNIWKVNANGRNLTQLTSTSDIYEGIPSYSYNGKKIVFVSNESRGGQAGDDYNVWSMDTNGSSKTQITELESWDSWPYWNENGIYFQSGRAQNPGEQIQRLWLLQR